jgi:hypothetical protein
MDNDDFIDLSAASRSLRVLEQWKVIIIVILQLTRRSCPFLGRWWSAWCRLGCRRVFNKNIDKLWTSPSLTGGCLKDSGFHRWTMLSEFTHHRNVYQSGSEILKKREQQHIRYITLVIHLYCVLCTDQLMLSIMASRQPMWSFFIFIRQALQKLPTAVQISMCVVRTVSDTRLCVMQVRWHCEWDDIVTVMDW